nr:NADH dehydrogenase subunit 2 [Polyplax reclinata]
MMFVSLLIMVVFSVILSVSSASLIWFWVSLEMASIFLIPLFNSPSLQSKEVMWEYFLTQALGSSGFLVSSFMKGSEMVFLKVCENHIFSWGSISLGFLFLKMGMPPFHSWSLRVVEVMSFSQLIYLLTLSKVVPLVGTWTIQPFVESEVWLFIALSLAFSLKGVIEGSIRRALVYSAILNILWVILGMKVSSTLAVWLFISYSMSILSILVTFQSSIFRLEDTLMCLSAPLGVKLSLAVNVLSLIGVPPTLGFFTKLSVLKNVCLGSSGSLVFIVFTVSMVFMIIYFWLISMIVLSKKTTFRLNLSMNNLTVCLLIFSAILSIALVIFQLI